MTAPIPSMYELTEVSDTPTSRDVVIVGGAALLSVALVVAGLTWAALAMVGT